MSLAAPPLAVIRKGEGRFVAAAYGTSIVFEFDHLRRERGELLGELRVTADLAGALTVDGVLATANINVSSVRAREDWAKRLARQSRSGGHIDWLSLMEEACLRVLDADRVGEPAVLLSDLPRPNPDLTLEIDGITLLQRHPVIWFGDGGTAKSYLALYIAGRLAQRGRRVGLFDWELAGEDHRLREEFLFGLDMPPITYARCSRPFVHERDRLMRFVRDHSLDFAIFDSVAFACDGPPEAAEVAGRYFQSLRQLGNIGSLHIAHVTKGDNSDQKPFGSTFWHNGARATWFIKQANVSPDGDEITVGLFNRKANLRGLRPAVGFRFIFGVDRTIVGRVDLADVDDLALSLTLAQRVQSVLKRSALTRAQLAAKFPDENPDSLRRAVNREIKRGKLIQFPANGEEWIALPARPERGAK